jgi:hypothetical protein
MRFEIDDPKAFGDRSAQIMNDVGDNLIKTVKEKIEVSV